MHLTRLCVPHAPHHWPTSSTDGMEQLLQDREINSRGQHCSTDMTSITTGDLQESMRTVSHIPQKPVHDQHICWGDEVRKTGGRPRVIPPEPGASLHDSNRDPDQANGVQCAIESHLGASPDVPPQ